jgi:hypothetical protein
MAQRLGIVRGLDYKKAGAIIAEKHEKIEDRIVNIIELNQERKSDNELFDEAINQKTESIKWYNFNQAVSVKQLVRLLTRAAFVLFIAAGLALAWPGLVTNGYHSVVQYRKATKKTDIEFRIINKELKVESGKDFTLEFEIISSNDIIAAEIESGTKKEELKKENSVFRYTFFAVNNPVSFTIRAGGKESSVYKLDVLRRPEIAGINLEIIPPKYTGLNNIVTESDGNVEIPSGSTVKWNLRTVHTNMVDLEYEDTISIKVKNNRLNYSRTFTRNTDYKIICKNSDSLKTEYEYKIFVVKDLFPEIEIEERIDSLQPEYVLINGVIEDDFGFDRLELIEMRNGRESVQRIPIKTDLLYQEFYKVLQLDTIPSIYFLRIYDNDKINGYKLTESRRILLKRKSLAEIAEENEIKAENISKDLDDGILSVEKLEDKIMQFRLNNLSNELNSWEIQEKIKEINDFINNLMNRIENIKKNNSEYTDNEKIMGDDEELVNKAEEIEDLLENIMDDELKELLNQFEKLSEEYNERLANDITEELEVNMEKLKEQMEMSLELLKKYELEKSLNNQIKELEKLSEKIEKERNETDSSREEIKEDYRKWEEKFENNIKDNKELKKPIKLNELQEERKEARDSVKELSESQKSNRERARQRAASRIMRLAEEMNNSCGASMESRQSVDIEELRQIRNALNDFSRRQEDLNESISDINSGNKLFVELNRDQKILGEKFEKIRDSLKSIGYEQPIVAKMIGQEMFHVENSFRNIMESFQQNRVAQVRIEQNRIMNEVNIVVLKLDELIKSTEKQSGFGSGKRGFTDSKRKQKGESKGSEDIGETKNMQESLKEQLKGAIQQLKEGKSGKQIRKDLSKMLGEREMMRKTAERLAQGGMLGENARERLMQAIEMMKEVEKDIVYDRMGDHTVDKDEWIKTRLIEAENAEKERENDNRRESKEFKGKYQPSNNPIDEINEPNKVFKQTLKYKELKLRKFYQDRYQEYIKSTKEK